MCGYFDGTDRQKTHFGLLAAAAFAPAAAAWRPCMCRGLRLWPSESWWSACHQNVAHTWSTAEGKKSCSCRLTSLFMCQAELACDSVRQAVALTWSHWKSVRLWSTECWQTELPTQEQSCREAWQFVRTAFPAKPSSIAQYWTCQKSVWGIITH